MNAALRPRLRELSVGGQCHSQRYWSFLKLEHRAMTLIVLPRTSERQHDAADPENSESHVSQTIESVRVAEFDATLQSYTFYDLLARPNPW